MERDSIEGDLELNFREFLEDGEEALHKQRYNASVASFFKAIAVLCDLKIYQARRTLPKSHSERFLFLKMHFKEAADIISTLFRVYTESYNLRMKLKDAILLRENVEKIKKLLEFKKSP